MVEKTIRLTDLTEKLQKKFKTRHHKKEGWINFFYENHKKKKLNNKYINDDKIEIKTIHQFKKGIFYKLHQYSVNNKYFNYYKVLKPELDKDNYFLHHLDMSCKRQGVVGYNKKYLEMRELQRQKLLKKKNPLMVNFD